jgi:hypothetical protein
MSCDDGNPCTQDSCSAGVCGSVGAPRSGCRTALKSGRLMKQNGGVNDKLTWKWTKGAATEQNHFADPTAGADYSLCIFANGAAISAIAIPDSATRWSEVSDKGYGYDDALGSAGGITKAKLKLKLLNQGNAAVTGDTTVTVRLSSDETVSDDDALLATVPATRLNIKPGKSKSLAASIVFPANVNDGSYQLLAVADPAKAIAESDETNNTDASTPIAVAKPFVNLSGTVKPLNAKQNKPATLSLSVTNSGNVPTTKQATPIRVILSSDGVFDDGVGETTLLDTTTSLSIKPGKSKTVKLKLPAVAVAPGTFATQVLIDPDAVTADADRQDNALLGSILVT